MLNDELVEDKSLSFGLLFDIFWKKTIFVL